MSSVGFIGLGNVGSKLAGTVVRSGTSTMVLDLDPNAMAQLVAAGAKPAQSPADLARNCDIVITCLPSPAVVAEVMESTDGVLAGLTPDSIWVEMSTTDAQEVLRLSARVAEVGGHAADCPVSGGCHRAATGNISIFAGCERTIFERLLPLLSVMGRRVLHTGELGSASQLKVMTNFLASANLIAVTEALAACAKVGLDLGIAYEAIAASSGNSFVHETEGQVILNGSYDIGFTMDLALKDMGFAMEYGRKFGVPLDVASTVQQAFIRAKSQYGGEVWSTQVVKLLEDALGTDLRAPGFPARLR